MGMSASQARLLSITSRLTNNEFRAQTITNSKLRLAEKSKEASEAYMDALNTKELMFGTYDENGDYRRTSLTPALLYQYQPLKNQYTLVNNAGKVLVTGQDAKNFEETKSLIEFLKRYDLVEENGAYATEMVEVDNPEYADYLNKCAEIDELNKSDNLAEKFSDIVGTSKNPKKDTGYCYAEALAGKTNCYLHLLNHLLDFDGEKMNINPDGYETSVKNWILKIKSDDLGGMGQCGDLKDVSAGINATSDITGKYLRVCDGIDVMPEGATGTNRLEYLGKNATNLDILMSDYTDNGDGTYSVKSLRQKVIDMYYIIQNNLVTDSSEMKDLLINFTEGDMKKMTLEKPEVVPATIMQEQAISVDNIVTDKEKAQWYTNLWYQMSGSEVASAIDLKEIYSECGDVVGKENRVDDKNKPLFSSNYAVLEDNLLTSSEWLQFALEHGVVSITQSQFYDPSADSEKVKDLGTAGFTFKSIAYSSATDITSQDNETAIAIAEVKYKNTLREIENKDKKYDQDLKKLDAEHSALQTEHDSIKEVISKNVERSFKAFS